MQCKTKSELNQYYSCQNHQEHFPSYQQKADFFFLNQEKTTPVLKVIDKDMNSIIVVIDYISKGLSAKCFHSFSLHA